MTSNEKIKVFIFKTLSEQEETPDAEMIDAISRLAARIDFKPLEKERIVTFIERVLDNPNFKKKPAMIEAIAELTKVLDCKKSNLGSINHKFKRFLIC